MFDLKMIRENPAAFDAGLERRGLPPQAEEILAWDGEHRAVIARKEALQAERNQVSKAIGAARGRGEDAAESMARIGAIRQEIQTLEGQEKAAAERLRASLEVLPNLPAADVPPGQDESDNQELRRSGEAAPFAGEPRRHFDLGEALGMMDFEGAAKLSGARFVILRRALARLERALANFMLDVHIQEHGLEETLPPFLVKRDTMYGTGQLPKFAEDVYHTEEDFWLIPTAEVPLTCQVKDTIVAAESLPLRYVAWTPCFRSEAGAAGRDTRGMLRQHQFSKVEMVSVTHPEQSDAELERMTGCAEAILTKLGLPYRVVLLCTGDMGFSARKTYDIEVWLQGEGAYREISSCSNCGDFQAVRMNARYKGRGDKGYVHTLNGSGLAVGRTMLALLEYHQQADGAIALPEVLRPYMGGVTVIGRGDEA